jgi:hypothetical protein
MAEAQGIPSQLPALQVAGLGSATARGKCNGNQRKEQIAMGVNARITLPAAARLRDVADVMGALAGHVMTKQPFSQKSDGWSAGRPRGAKGIRIEPCKAMVEWVLIFLDNTADVQLPDGQCSHYVMYHFEGGKNGERLMLPPSTEFWIAIGKGLVDFFGGSIDYNDCDDVAVDYEQTAREDIHAETDDGWYSLQNRKLAVCALTQSDLKYCRDLAACR